MDLPEVRVTETFHSIQTESLSTGELIAFVRLTGCPLRCSYCDTAYAFKGGAWWEIPAILEQIADYRVRHVCVTGGEPLAQAACLDLLGALCDAGYQVSLETSGAMNIRPVDPRVVKVLDLKTPGSDGYALSVNDGQRHRAELGAATRVAQALGVREHRIVPISIAQFGGSALADPAIPIPERPLPGDPHHLCPGP
jgi:organic radical activating enzyme